MTRAWTWALGVVLAGGLATNLGLLLRGRAEEHAVLPIFVPVSLEMEKAMRAERGQPAGRGGEEAVELARGLGARPPADDATRAQLAAMKQSRDHLLQLRDERHQLNTRLMQVGVEVGRVLTPEQWAVIVQKRDELRRPGDAAVFDRALGTGR